MIFWIDKNKFATGLLAKAFQQKSTAFYTVDSVNDFSYLVDDLEPSVVVLDGETFAQNPEAFLKQYSESKALQSLPFIFLAPAPKQIFTSNVLGEINRPFDPFQIPDLIEKLRKAN